MAEERSVPRDAPKTTPTMGYKPGGRSQVFQLKEGEKLPEGWQSKPPAGEHPHDLDGTNPQAESKAEGEKGDDRRGQGQQGGQGGQQSSRR